MKKNYYFWIGIIVIILGILLSFIVLRKPSLQQPLEIYSITIAVCAILATLYVNEKEEEERQKVRENQYKENLVMKAIRTLSTYDNKSESIPSICVTLCELMQIDFKTSKDKLKQKIEKFSKLKQIDDQDIKDIYDILHEEFQHVKNDTINALNIMLENKDILIPRSVEDVVNFLMGKIFPYMRKVDSRRIELILATCIENDKIGKEITKDQIKDVWKKEADVDPDDDFQKGHATNPCKVEKILQELDGRRKGQKEIKNILKFNENLENFKIEEKDKKFIEEVLFKLQEEQEKAHWRIKGKGVIE